MVRLDRITTRGGDRGETSLGDGTRLRKDARRIEAIGRVDETNAAIGLMRLVTGAGEAGSDLARADGMLDCIQHDLFDLGADLCTPFAEGEDQTRTLRIVPAQLARLEAEIAAMNAELPPLRSFVLPGGTPASAWAHHARTVARAAERAVVALAAAEPVNPDALRYLNRLSDHLFVLGRWLNRRGGAEVLWRPGVNR
ncbi:cob(I)yrinic acid a,c-diamide adenosyltransferase [Elioraea sp.]|jgi:cob(I)alamin adenosyltransferase|uniref:cob(I)yrinic acid a,c-diamide adenosyltransferase n=1 Tax=Elioraea sp. TaxID=2185103 RepID=UPI0021DC665F|nr:cob(I)yrinic acid a,c-diamide adenosyltransferase [Elioraea sp.]GIX09242.1 MAG: cob(I)yrinic acid a,c-diamide adenosyltransferase [Elioraea sp.]